MKGYDLSKYMRLVAIEEGERVKGTFWVTLADEPEGTSWITSVDVTIWDSPEQNSGRVFYSRDLTGSVTAGVATLSKHMVASTKLAEVEDVWDEMLAALVESERVARESCFDGKAEQ